MRRSWLSSSHRRSPENRDRRSPRQSRSPFIVSIRQRHDTQLAFLRHGKVILPRDRLSKDGRHEPRKVIRRAQPGTEQDDPTGGGLSLPERHLAKILVKCDQHSAFRHRSGENGIVVGTRRQLLDPREIVTGLACGLDCFNGNILISKKRRHASHRQRVDVLLFQGLRGVVEHRLDVVGGELRIVL